MLILRVFGQIVATLPQDPYEYGVRFPPLTPLVKAILLALTGCYVTQLVLEVWMGQQWVAQLMLYPEPGVHSLWQIVTYPLYQSRQVWDFLLSFVFFWWIVSPYELAFGRPHTIRLLAVSSVAGALPVLVFGLIFGDGGDAMMFTAGPVAAGPLLSVHCHILGVIAAYAWSMRFRGNMSFFGVLSLSSKQLLALLVAISGLHFLATTNITNLLADLGCIAGGLYFTEWLSKGPKKKKKKRENKAGLRLVEGGKDDPPKWLN